MSTLSIRIWLEIDHQTAFRAGGWAFALAAGGALASVLLEVGAAADEQARTSAEVAEQVDVNLDRVAHNAAATGQMAQTVAEVARTAAELARVAEDQNQQVGQFQV